MLQDFKALMKRLGAEYTPETLYEYTLTVAGHKLGLTPFPDKRDPWIACKWLCEGNRALLDAYRQAGGDYWQPSDQEPPQVGALYNAWRASQEAEAAAIKAKNLPYNNPYSLKWNHHGADCVQMLAAGLAPYFNPQQLEA